ncbi:CBS domain-containing protein [Candidatus Woesearchaeota archaeon]|nr:CBS domain-containing protein [Candidatus Woesearchaeota archaeon]
MKTGYRVADCMTIRPITVDKALSLVDAAKFMHEKHVGSLIVVENGKLHGLVTEQDLVRKAMAVEKDPATTRLDEIMNRELITISPDKDIYEALTIMRDYNIRHIPVLDKGQMVGFLTIKDILKIQPQLFDIVVEKFEIKERARKPVITNIVEDDKGFICEQCKNYSDDLLETDGLYLCESCRNDEGEEEE